MAQFRWLIVPVNMHKGVPLVIFKPEMLYFLSSKKCQSVFKQFLKNDENLKLYMNDQNDTGLKMIWLLITLIRSGRLLLVDVPKYFE
jgi:hypothetical protein